MDREYLELLADRTGVEVPDSKEPINTGLKFKDMSEAEKTPFYHPESSANDRSTRIFLKFIRPALAECTAVFSFVWIATVAQGRLTILGVGLSYALTFMGLTACYAGVSGAHLNPAVTVGVILAGECEILVGIVYFISQIIGGLLGAAFAKVCMNFTISPDTTLYDAVDGGSVLLSPNMTSLIGTIVVTIMTTIYVLTFILTAVEQGTPIAPLAIGFVLGAVTLASNGLPLNPAQSLGVAVVSGVWTDQWVFWAGPALGAVVAGILYRIVLAGSDKRLFFKDKVY